MTIKHTAGGTRYEQHGTPEQADKRTPHGRCPFGEADCADPTHAKLWEIQHRA